MAPRKKATPIEVLESTGEIPIISVDIPTDYETLTPDPVPASAHVVNQFQEMTTFPKPAYDKLLPVVSTIMASVCLGALILGIGILVGAEL
jgi:hypothetical protein